MIVLAIYWAACLMMLLGISHYDKDSPVDALIWVLAPIAVPYYVGTVLGDLGSRDQ
jgi:hypothetical protein